jgi:hypothetical protein
MALKFLESTVPPINDPIVDPKRAFLLTDVWRQWFGRVPSTFGSIPNVLNVATVTAQSASLPATDFQNTTLQQGLYRATYRAHITQAATTSSSLIVTFTWTDDGVTQVATGPAIVGNTTATGQSDSILMKVDAGTSVQYSTTYASVGATAMQYALNATLEKIQI